jgi:phosphoribosylanthranilate isomerase
MTWVKICGMTNLEDALTAVDAGADALGFVFYEKSPRNISVEAAREIVQQLPKKVEKVGVFVDQPAQQLADISDRVGLNAVQLYLLDSDGSQFFADFPPSQERRTFLAIPAERITSGEAFEISFSLEFLNRTSALFLDSGNRQQPGGTGKVFDWRIAADTVKAMSEIIPIVIAGGLSMQNVGEAIDVLHPWGVDVASGVEARPGKKDPEKVRAFVKAVRNADRKAS